MVSRTAAMEIRSRSHVTMSLVEITGDKLLSTWTPTASWPTGVKTRRHMERFTGADLQGSEKFDLHSACFDTDNSKNYALTQNRKKENQK